MKIIIDTNVLIYMMKKNNKIDRLFNPVTKTEITYPELRAEALLDQIEANGDVIVIPTPVLAEYLLGVIGHNEQEKHIIMIEKMSCFEILPFEEISALECAQLPTLKELREMIGKDITASKIKFDRQIVAIAKAFNINEVWTHDSQVFTKCQDIGITVKSLADISPIPEQFSLYQDQNSHTTH
ncbi:type II toxin-antitoxin system VapC family toxin [Xenorhabdus stockiae]|uniref:type II toxin-antitoxin system VapC family toxin n=1 Tax=Xenorhabdus stockiae TaxID=351614 RepID=UPI0040631050